MELLNLKNLKSLLVVVLLSFSSITQSAVISVDDAVFGADSVTRDTASGLEWLDIDLAGNRNYFDLKNEMTSSFGLGKQGWRYASRVEWKALIENYFEFPSDRWALEQSFIQVDVYPYPYSNYVKLNDDILTFINLVTSYQNQGLSISGLINDVSWSSGSLKNGQLGSLQSGNWSNQITRISVGNYTSIKLPGNYYSQYLAIYPESPNHWLVRNFSNIPEPSILALMVLGIFGLGMVRRRKVQG